ncbi:MAG: lipase family protein [Bacteroidota bacterium]
MIAHSFRLPQTDVHSTPVCTTMLQVNRTGLHLLSPTRSHVIPKKSTQTAVLTRALGRKGFPLLLSDFLARTSTLTYRTPEVIAQRLRSKAWGCSHAQVFAYGDVVGIGFVLEGHAVLAFRGTATVRDWVFNAKMTRLGRLGEHRGFKALANGLRASIDAWLGSIDDISGLILTGHSRGGALATILARDLHEAGRTVRAVITYGAPRVGGRTYRADYTRRLGRVTWRVVWGSDLVPQVPARWMGYRHVGIEIRLTAEQAEAFARARWSAAVNRLKQSVKDHLIPNGYGVCFQRLVDDALAGLGQSVELR